MADRRLLFFVIFLNIVSKITQHSEFDEIIDEPDLIQVEVEDFPSLCGDCEGREGGVDSTTIIGCGGETDPEVPAESSTPWEPSPTIPHTTDNQTVDTSTAPTTNSTTTSIFTSSPVETTTPVAPSTTPDPPPPFSKGGCKINTCVRNPFDCKMYYMCITGDAWHIFRCAKGLSFDTENCECSKALFEECNDVEMPPFEDSSAEAPLIPLWFIFVSLLVIFLVLVFFALECEVALIRSEFFSRRRFSCSRDEKA